MPSHITALYSIRLLPNNPSRQRLELTHPDLYLQYLASAKKMSALFVTVNYPLAPCLVLRPYAQTTSPTVSKSKSQSTAAVHASSPQRAFRPRISVQHQQPWPQAHHLPRHKAARTHPTPLPPHLHPRAKSISLRLSAFNLLRLKYHRSPTPQRDERHSAKRSTQLWSSGTRARHRTRL